MLLFPTSTTESPNMFSAGTRGSPWATEKTTTTRNEPKRQLENLIFFSFPCYKNENHWRGRETERVRKEEKNLQHGSVEDAGGGEFKTGKSCE